LRLTGPDIPRRARAPGFAALRTVFFDVLCAVLPTGFRALATFLTGFWTALEATFFAVGRAFLALPVGVVPDPAETFFFVFFFLADMLPDYRSRRCASQLR
jgi:hypothetical protein